MDRQLNATLGSRLFAVLSFRYTDAGEGNVTITRYRPAEGDFGDLPVPVVPDYALTETFAHGNLDSWAETLSFDKQVLLRHLQSHPGPAVDTDALTWDYVATGALTRYLVLDADGNTTGLVDIACHGPANVRHIRLRSALRRTADFEWVIRDSQDDAGCLHTLMAQGKIPDGKEVRPVG